MNILIISEVLPYTPEHEGATGATLKMYYMVKYLAERGHKLTVISFFRDTRELSYIDDVKQFCEDIYPIKTSRDNNLILRIARFLFVKKPRILTELYSPEMIEIIQRVIDKKNFDVIHLDLPLMAEYYPYIKNYPNIIAPHDCQFFSLKQNFHKSKGLKKLHLLFHMCRFRIYEPAMYAKFDNCLLVAPADKKELLKLSPNIDITVAPNGVDFDYFSPDPSSETELAIVFTGLMNYQPNCDAVIWFTRKILPFIRNAVPEVTFYVVGQKPPAEIQRLAQDKKIIVTGFVEDIRDYLNRSMVYVCPLRMGTGIKNKLLEAMSMALPIVATPLSVSGIDVRDGESIVLADNPSEFSAKVVKLLRNETMRTKIGKEARKIVKQKYSWHNTVSIIEKMYEEAIDRKSTINQK